MSRWTPGRVEVAVETACGLWPVALRGDVTVERLNADLGPAAPDPWEWLDEQEPLAAGAFRLAREGE